MKHLIELNVHERNAALRAYNSSARDTLDRGAMVDAIIAAINEERADPSDIVANPCMYCDEPAIKKHLCNRHYTQMYRTGNPLTTAEAMA